MFSPPALVRAIYQTITSEKLIIPLVPMLVSIYLHLNNYLFYTFYAVNVFVIYSIYFGFDISIVVTGAEYFKKVHIFKHDLCKACNTVLLL
jgi:hypothetical protein